MITLKILTIVVPSYNTELYIDECLPTVISSKSIDDIEILLVNDGSTDNTLKKARYFEELYPQSIRVIDKENGGHGSVINRGIKEATGKYFKVIDGDDWVDTAAFNQLVSCLKRVDVDLVMNPYIIYNVATKKETIVNKIKIPSNRIFTFEDYLNLLPLMALHAITYRTDILRLNGIYLQEKCFYEDAEYDIYPMLYIKSFLYLEKPVYIYRIGTLTQSVNPVNAIRNKKMLSIITDNLIRFYKNMPAEISTKRKKYVENQICHIIRNNYAVYLKMPIGIKVFNSIKKYDRALKKKSIELYHSSSSLSIKALRMNNYLVYIIECQLFYLLRRKRGF